MVYKIVVVIVIYIQYVMMKPVKVEGYQFICNLLIFCKPFGIIFNFMLAKENELWLRDRLQAFILHHLFSDK